ncbi:MAG: hypothetical protein ACE5KM_09590 [Planctomycetaceae bacterium]
MKDKTGTWTDGGQQGQRQGAILAAVMAIVLSLFSPGLADDECRVRPAPWIRHMLKRGVKRRNCAQLRRPLIAQRPIAITVPAIRKALARRISVDWKAKSLEDAMDEIADRSGVHIFIDYQALVDDGVKADSPITFNVRNTTIRCILDCVVRGRVKLDWVIEDEVVKIRTIEKSEWLLRFQREWAKERRPRGPHRRILSDR